MEQSDKMIGLIRTLAGYLGENLIECEQIPIGSISGYISDEYKRLGFDGEKIAEVYKRLSDDHIKENNRNIIGALLDIMMSDCELIKKADESNARYDDELRVKMSYKTELLYYRNLEKNRLHENEYNEQRREGFYKGKGAVYTAVTGDYDNIKEPELIDERLDYYLFTDNDEISSDVWKVIKVDNDADLDTTRLARKIKIIGCYDYLADYDYTVWCDGKTCICGDILDYISRYSKGAPILCMNHYRNDDIYQESETCISLNKDMKDVIVKQMGKYRNEGMPEHSGMIDSCLLVRDNHSDKLKKAMHDWWNEVLDHSKRDQLSFNYICWKNGILYDTSPLVPVANNYIKTYAHK